MNLSISKEWFERKEALEASGEIGAGFRPCYCIGPQNGASLCPCMMVVTGETDRHVERRDLGRALKESRS